MNDRLLFILEAAVCSLSFYAIPFTEKKKDSWRACVCAALMILTDCLRTMILPDLMRKLIWSPAVSSGWFDHLSGFYSRVFGSYLIEDLLTADYILSGICRIAAAAVILAAVRKIRPKNAVYCASLLYIFRYLHECMNVLLRSTWLLKPLMSTAALSVLAGIMSAVVLAVILRKMIIHFELTAFEESSGMLTVIVSLVVLMDRITAAFILTEDLRYPVSLLFLTLLFFLLSDSRIRMKRSIAREMNRELMLQAMKKELEQMHQSDVTMTGLKHEMLHHLQIIRKFNDNHDPEGAEKYIQAAIAEYDSRIQYEKTYNQYLNSLLAYLQKRYPDIETECICMLGSDCPAAEMDIALLVLCLADAQIRNCKGNNHGTLRIELKQVEQDVSVIVSIQQNETPPDLTETEKSILGQIIAEYSGEYMCSEKYKGDICVFLHCRISNIHTGQMQIDRDNALYE